LLLKIPPLLPLPLKVSLPVLPPKKEEPHEKLR
jgi:hypothetical protein